MVVLAMHGSPPEGFPETEMEEIYRIHKQLRQADGALWDSLIERSAYLDDRMKRWPRTAQNDPYFTGAQALARQLEEASGHRVVVAFNEYCFPGVEEGLDSAVALGAAEIWVITPMMTPGGGHSEVDIPSAIGVAQSSHPSVPIRYVWPFEIQEIAGFLTRQLELHRDRWVRIGEGNGE